MTIDREQIERNIERAERLLVILADGAHEAVAALITEARALLSELPEQGERVPTKDIDGKEGVHTQEELNMMIVALEETGRYDVVGRRW